VLALVLALDPATAAPGPRGSDGPIIGVQIDAGPEVMKDIDVAQGGLVVEWPGGRRTFPRGTHRLALTERGAVLGELDFGRDIPFRFRAEPHAIKVGERYYEGWIEVLVPADGAPWRVVNRLPLERYLLGVVPGEMPAGDYPQDALGAQAVAARTYALFQILVRPADARVHVHADDRSQVYLGGGMPHPRALEAVERTRGQVLLHGGKVFESFYHSTCGGATRGVEDWFGGDPIAPLSSVSCQGCGSSKYFRWTARLPEARLRGALDTIARRHQIALGEVFAIEPVEPAPGGHCAYVRIRHEKGAFEVDADRFRRACRAEGIELRSTAFIAERQGDEFLFHGRGWGHGVGLCQVGAKGYAEREARYGWILSWYYPGSELSTLWR
jgi:stage II sporulation protein D